jgi:hypothetical protein
MKTPTIIVGNSNNCTDFSILSGKSETVESNFVFIGIEVEKILFKRLRYPNMYMHIGLRDL